MTEATKEKPARKRVSAYKSVEHDYSVGDAVSGAFEELQSLRDEMSEWRDNMSSGNMEHMEKYSEVESAADTLDSNADSEPDVPECATELRFKVQLQENRRKGRGDSRSVRCSNAAALLSGAAGACEERMSEIDDEIEALEKKRNSVVETEDTSAELSPEDEMEQAGNDIETLESQKSELESLKDELENIASEMDGVDFPGMY